ncbi:hypothetical protein PUN28_003627 [Cardiocondyla obscurior]|uniref:Reverse transcriptase Ty1/copia-type domain-containing protein n=1 Tax=Cardiocondyla obscurior TaxID=286306 RepID=A0AAW2GKC3_9HYME
MAAQHRIFISQLDITAAYLHGEMDIQTFMKSPELLEEMLERILENETNNLRKKARTMLSDYRQGQTHYIISEIYLEDFETNKNIHDRDSQKCSSGPDNSVECQDDELQLDPATGISAEYQFENEPGLSTNPQEGHFTAPSTNRTPQPIKKKKK